MKTKLLSALCSVLMLTAGSKLFAQEELYEMLYIDEEEYWDQEEQFDMSFMEDEDDLVQKERFGDERIEKLIADYTAQTSANKKKYKTLSRRWVKGDYTLTGQEITFLRCYYTTTSDYNPLKIDELGEKIYHLNEDGKYKEAIKLCKELEKICPFNLISFKETAYAIQQLEKDDKKNIWINAVKISEAMCNYGEDFERKSSNMVAFDAPFFPLSLYEGVIIYDMTRGFPRNILIMQLANEQTAVMYTAHESGKWAFLLSQWAYFNHAKDFYKDKVVDLSDLQDIYDVFKCLFL